VDIATIPNPPAEVRTVLCVDDEPHVLSALRRALRAPELKLCTAEGGAPALELLAREPVDLIISDMRMPGMTGTQLLGQVQRSYPDVVRVVLTGQADMHDTIAAINHGSIFRYLQKPWNDEELRQVVRQGLERRALEMDRRRLQALTQDQNAALRDANLLLEQRVAERTAALASAHDRLKQTHVTTIQVFTNLLELRSGRLVGHGRRVGDMARRIGKAMGCPEEAQQELLIAGLLHDIGYISLPDQILMRPVGRLADEDLAQYRKHPLTGENALMAVDEMQGVAALIHAHHERHDGKGFPDGRSGHDIPLGARILAVADVYDAVQCGLLVDTVATSAEARAMIRHARGAQFDPEVVEVFLHITEPVLVKATELRLSTAQLTPGMVLAADLLSSRGLLMLTKGRAISGPLIQRIREFETHEGGQLNLLIRPGTGETREAPLPT
jgi:response regulator RpfG family c-di-GMP phosphodiesterase